MGIRRISRVKTEEESLILTGLIVSDQYCQEMLSKLKEDYFDSEYAKIIYKWVVDYYFKYNKAPFSSIQDIFLVEKSNYEDEIVKLIELFLSNLSERFQKEDKNYNWEYCRDQSIPYIKQKELQRVADHISSNIKLGRIDDAISAYNSFTEVEKEISSSYDFWSFKDLEEKLERKSSKLFSFPGVLGDLLKDFERGRLVSVIGPFKRGKSWTLQEFAIEGSLHGYNVLYISLEMSEEEMITRMLMRLLNASSEAGEFRIPVFDCKHNQNGTCRKKERKNKSALILDGQLPKYSKDLKYSVCTACRGLGDDYACATWFDTIKTKRLTPELVKHELQGSSFMGYGDIKLLTYPTYTANLKHIELDMSRMEITENFTPDIIVIDYADILMPENRRIEGRDRYDETWKTLKSLASSRHCLVVTASQANKASAEKRTTRSTDVAEDYRKNAHADLMIMLSQTDNEKRKGVMRYSCLGRHDNFMEGKQVCVLQNLSLGKAILDSEWADDIEEDEDKGYYRKRM